MPRAAAAAHSRSRRVGRARRRRCSPGHHCSPPAAGRPRSPMAARTEYRNTEYQDTRASKAARLRFRNELPGAWAGREELTWQCMIDAGQPAGQPGGPGRRGQAGHGLLRGAPGSGGPRSSGSRSAPRDTAARRCGASFNDDHIAATTQAICDYRARAGTTGPLFLGRDTHALSEPAFVTALEVLAANEVTVLVDSRDGYTPTPALSRAILIHNDGRDRRPGRRDRDHPVAQPARGRRVQVQPARRRPGRARRSPRSSRTGPTSCWPAGCARSAGSVRRGQGRAGPGPVRLPRRVRGAAADRGGPGRDPRRRHPDRRRPARRGQRGVLGRDRRPVRARPDRGQPGWWTPRSGS